MDLLKEIIIKILSNEKSYVSFNITEEEIFKAVNNICLDSLNKIKKVIDDENYEDFECIEKIIEIFDEIGSPIINRHDFG